MSDTKTEIKESIQTTQKKPETPEEKIMRDFSFYILNNRVKFSDIFNPKNEVVTHAQVKTAFTSIKFPFNLEDLNRLLLFLDPYNSGKINLVAIKKFIKDYCPDYFDKQFHNTHEKVLKREFSLSNKILSHPHLKNIIDSVNDFISNNKLKVEDFFNKTGKKELNEKEFVDLIFTANKDFKENEIKELFSFLDRDKSKSLVLGELLVHFNNAILSLKQKRERIVISTDIIENINNLFDFFDKNKDGTISKEELFTSLKAVNHNISMEDVDLIMKKVDKDRSGNLDRNEFTEIMKEHFKEEAFLAEEDKDFALNLFKEETTENEGYLTVQQFKSLMINKLNADFDDNELDELIHSTDCNFDGLIDIEEFMRLLAQVENVGAVRKTIKGLKMKKQFDPLVFLNIFHGLPSNFIPSFIRDQELNKKVLPSSTLRPKTDPTGILYEDISVENDSKLKKGNTNILKQIDTVVNCKIQIAKATGVPIPDESSLDRNKGIVGRVLRIGLFNSTKNCFIGNTAYVNAKWNQDYEDRWTFIDDRYNFNNNILVRFNNLNE